MNFPFEMQSMLETMTDCPLVLSNNHLNKFKFVQEVVLAKDGRISGNTEFGKWEVEDGVLRFLSDKGHLITEFRILETRNGCVYAVGRNVLEPESHLRLVLNIKKPLGDDFGICISSGTAYEKLTIPKILRSLEGDGFDMNRVVVVVGNDVRNDNIVKLDSEFKVTTVRKRQDIHGMTALNNIPDIDKKSYWFLLHDTCEVTNGFTKNISNIDVGLNPDVVSFRPLEEKIELGLYRAKFVSVCTIPTGVKLFDHFQTVVNKAKIVNLFESSFKREPARDVYGKGIIREVVNFNNLGFRKYKSKLIDVKKP